MVFSHADRNTGIHLNNVIYAVFLNYINIYCMFFTLLGSTMGRSFFSFFFSDCNSDVQDGLFGEMIQVVDFPLQRIQNKSPPQPPLLLAGTEFSDYSTKEKGHGNTEMVIQSAHDNHEKNPRQTVSF